MKRHEGRHTPRRPAHLPALERVGAPLLDIVCVFIIFVASTPSCINLLMNRLIQCHPKNIRAIFNHALGIKPLCRSWTSGTESPFGEIDEGHEQPDPASNAAATHHDATMTPNVTHRNSVASVNRVLLVGNVGKDPLTRQLASGEQTVTVFPLATNELPSSSASMGSQATQWHNIAIYDSP